MSTQIITYPNSPFELHQPFAPAGDQPTAIASLVEGINDAGLSFSVLAFASTQGPRDAVEKTKAVLAAIDLGAWSLGSFQTVAQLKAALEKQIGRAHV